MLPFWQKLRMLPRNKSRQTSRAGTNSKCQITFVDMLYKYISWLIKSETITIVLFIEFIGVYIFITMEREWVTSNGFSILYVRLQIDPSSRSTSIHLLFLVSFFLLQDEANFNWNKYVSVWVSVYVTVICLSFHLLLYRFQNYEIVHRNTGM